ncbi:hypothetical protein H072_1029 [Dactylellina haptotyla CBS 200.50]|uniref:AAA+ ATPase domain-containing protein n=1 Tax=Dactylellina haptotyla (strain CBS 200.50) TaxID=1284197 RepID=S8AQ07_DACHA|nr:hypothetical protein H072_1029 [Dactylellina haptotyla CBS 200.50]
MHVATRRALHSVLRTSRNNPLPLLQNRYHSLSSHRSSPPRSTFVCYRCSYLHLSARLQSSQLPSSSEQTESSAVSKESESDNQTNTSTPSTPSTSSISSPSSAAPSSPSPEESNTDENARAPTEGEVSLTPDLISSIRSATSGGDGADPEQPDKRPAPRTVTRSRVTKRVVKVKEDALPKIDLPEWFLERAVFLPEELETSQSKLDIVDRFGSDEPLDEDGPVESTRDAEGGKPTGSSGGSGPSKEVDVEEEAVKLLEAKIVEGGSSQTATPLTEEAPEAGRDAEEDTKAAKEADSSKSTAPSSDAKPSQPAPTDPEAKLPAEPTGENDVTPNTDLPKPEIAFFTPSTSLDSKYGLSPAVWGEVLSTAKATISLPKSVFNQAKISRTVDCTLMFPQTPETNGTYFLDAVSEEIARNLGATLIRIDAEDVAEIAGDYIETPAPIGKQAAAIPMPPPTGELRTLGYDAQFIHPNNRPRGEEEEEEAEIEQEPEETEQQEDGESSSPDFDDSNRPYTASGPPAPVFGQGGSLAPFLKKLFLPGGGAFSIAAIGITEVDGAPNIQQGARPGEPNVIQMGPPPPDTHPKLQTVLQLMLDSGNKKRETIDKTPGSKPPPSTNRTIIQVRDFKELHHVAEGKSFLRILRKLVYERRLEGREIMILGNSATIGHGIDLNASYLSAIQLGLNAPSSGIMERSIVVPPQPWDSTRELLERDRKARIREINMRHLKAMITRRSGEEGHAVVLEVPKDWHFENTPKVSHASDWVWDLDSVHRLTLALIGGLPSPGATELGPRVIGPNDVAEAIKVIRRSDKAKLAWSNAEAKFAEEREMAEEEEPTAEEARATKLRKLKGTCNKHEKRLLGGVIDPSSMTTGFDQVRAAEETVDALKTLTSLSLLRPEAFSYGVLAQDKIPGVLLYGPPGTGKTLLAKAVAKESGATVLEVSGSEVYDMYVGEGEKNVKAIFSLAKKLSPCVVFIDEADAIFGARTAHHQRTSHRELINQFLKEWDGMAKMSAFIMVATNRPFDLDDAVLRRLPRRILIDLPTAADRHAIMKIHLDGEELDPDVDLSAISSDEKTNLYSGSDLKNVAVSAALAAVKDEDKIFKETGVYPAKRVLKAKHFDQALGEITASISDDMGSLGMIRKFDEKYGDRKGRKKKASRWGFGGEVGPQEEIKERGTGRVRN